MVNKFDGVEKVDFRVMERQISVQYNSEVTSANVIQEKINEDTAFNLELLDVEKLRSAS